jgi:hypothetical protein
MELKNLDDETDQLIKKWYKVMKASYDPGSPEYEALESIPTEGGTPAPDPIEINTVTQGGEWRRRRGTKERPRATDAARGLLLILWSSLTRPPPPFRHPPIRNSVPACGGSRQGS